MSQFLETFRNVWNSIKKRIDTKESANHNADETVEEQSNNVTEAIIQTTEPALQPHENETTSDIDIDIDINNEKSDIDQYWENWYTHNLKEPLIVSSLKQSSMGDAYRIKHGFLLVLMSDNSFY